MQGNPSNSTRGEAACSAGMPAMIYGRGAEAFVLAAPRAAKRVKSACTGTSAILRSASISASSYR